jgi:hypothetical protein
MTKQHGTNDTGNLRKLVPSTMAYHQSLRGTSIVNISEIFSVYYSKSGILVHQHKEIHYYILISPLSQIAIHTRKSLFFLASIIYSAAGF